MAYDFKKLSDVAVVETPAETANVLIEEDGVIKKAPKTAVGGAGGDYDLDILCEASDWSSITSDSYSLVSGDYTNALEKLSTPGTFPNVRIRFILNEASGESRNDFVEFAEVVPAVMWLGGEGFRFGWIIYQQGDTYTGVIDLNSNGFSMP